ncbi:Hypothetical protein I595_648 [Croceitalea dokdonensis DOKDO 023]|uniref:Adenylosuccinate lyase n=1 Tax=Croceitalea dokdonensis DOKDO 023 TaxID=1300341 RepID=A0A0P7AJE5_9FLAO|nr:hypothetical protein [Croceitalea dokdonensis]KPM33742.1 Hypothetical protein I595_648 [Croceitalea dokdonensis DOKDO 023]
MTKEELHIALNSGRLSKVKIDLLVAKLKTRPDVIQPLLTAIFEQDKNNEFNASWVFDHLMREKLHFLIPHVSYFIRGTSTLTSESCMRPMAHTCQLLTEAYFKEAQPAFTDRVKVKELEPLVSICFDWLIGTHKAATKVFAMTSLYYLGKGFPWIHPELKQYLENTFSEGTPGYKNRAGKLLELLKKKTNF